MPAVDIAMTLYATVAANAETLPELSQVQMATMAAAAKSPAGDKVLTSLAHRNDLCASARKILESSPRAAVKAAWLSRKDHTDAYVTAAISKEKRVTVLAAVAAHPEASVSLQAALAAKGHVSVSIALLRRDGLTPEVAETVMVTLLNEYNSLTWAQRGLFTQKLAAMQEAHPRIAAAAKDKTAIGVLLNQNTFVFPEAELPRVASILLNGWQDGIAKSQIGNVGKLVTQPNWQPGSDEDFLAATVAKAASEHQARVAATSRYGHVQLLRPEVVDCIARNFGSEQERQAAAERRQKRANEVYEAEHTADPERIRAISTSRDSVLVGALCRNPNLKLEHLNEVFSLEIVYECISRGDDRLLGIAMLLLNSYGRVGADMHFTDEEAPELAAKAVEYMRRSERMSVSAYWGPAGVLLRNERLVAYVTPLLTATELVQLLELDAPDIDRATLGKTVGELLGKGLQTDQQWQTFTALIAEMEAPVSESIAIAGSI